MRHQFLRGVHGGAGGYTPTDPDAAAYIAAVEVADGNVPLEDGVREAIDDFVIGCKADGIWSAIKGSCILSGARTLAGALIPLVGPAPTNVGPFVSGDYNRKTGLATNGTTKVLNSNISTNTAGTFETNNHHLAIYVSNVGAFGFSLAGYSVSNTLTLINYISPSTGYRLRSSMGASSVDTGSSASGAGFVGIARPSGANFTWRVNAATAVASVGSISQANSTVGILGYGNSTTTVATDRNSRISFYSIGVNTNLASLRNRVDTLVTDFAAAIP